jgi:xanthine dehydrogenase accessory factor
MTNELIKNTTTGFSVWQFIQAKLAAGLHTMLLLVVQSEGSSPGRQGFKMAVAADGNFTGTIGGGIMEFKLVEKAKTLLHKKEASISLMHQHHDKEWGAKHSGMICSGSQIVVFVPINGTNKHVVDSICDSLINNKEKSIAVLPKNIFLEDGTKKEWRYFSDEEWQYAEPLQQQPTVHIIGGGHVSLALSELLHFIGFTVNVYDDRPDLNTLSANNFTAVKQIVDYNSIGENIFTNENDYVVIMTIGYRTDKIVLKQLIARKLAYLGMLGSRKKVDTLFAELKAEGLTALQLDKVSSPVGLQINSHTAQEIAVSIAAEIIQHKNKR